MFSNQVSNIKTHEKENSNPNRHIIVSVKKTNEFTN